MEDVTLQIADQIGTITFGHPAQNSLPGHLLQKLASTIQAAGQDHEIRVIVLRSHGDRTFCAGASFDELAAINDLETGKKFFSGFAQVINAMRKCPKFIIGRIQGKAVGGGVGLAAAMDYCIASMHASVKLSELAVGIGPFVVGPACERKLGTAAFTQLAINASEWQTAAWAKDKGLYQECFDQLEQVDAYIAHLANILRQYSPEASKALKEVAWAGTEDWDQLLDDRAMISGRLVLSDFTKNAIAAFKQKA
ncbi:MAG: enoyl-CoA hydratase/isomerase family protein [Saprospiraceae bacterium]